MFCLQPVVSPLVKFMFSKTKIDEGIGIQEVFHGMVSRKPLTSGYSKEELRLLRSERAAPFVYASLS